MSKDRKSSRKAQTVIIGDQSQTHSLDGATGQGSNGSLQGQLLVASPHMEDLRFAKTVILLCQHDEESAMGLVVNKLSDELKLGDIYEKLDFGAPRFNAASPVHIGGPVDSNRGFVLHTQDHMLPESLPITHDIGLTATIEILRDITDGTGPVHSIVSLGCAGWGAGQLDREIADNAWLSLPSSPELVFETDRTAVWQKAFDRLGIDPAYYAGTAGNA